MQRAAVHLASLIPTPITLPTIIGQQHGQHHQGQAHGPLGGAAHGRGTTGMAGRGAPNTWLPGSSRSRQELPPELSSQVVPAM